MNVDPVSKDLTKMLKGFKYDVDTIITCSHIEFFSCLKENRHDKTVRHSENADAELERGEQTLRCNVTGWQNYDMFIMMR